MTFFRPSRNLCAATHLAGSVRAAITLEADDNIRHGGMMGNRLLMWWAFVATVGVADGLARAADQDQPAKTSPTAVGSVASLTATGCLEPWRSKEADVPAGTPRDRAPAGVDYMLTGVEGQAIPAAGTGTRQSRLDDARLLLLSAPGIDFKSHVNQTVKIVGTIAPQPSEGASPAEHAADPSRSETNLPAAAPSEAFRLNLVQVSSLTIVAKTCGK